MELLYPVLHPHLALAGTPSPSRPWLPPRTAGRRSTSARHPRPQLHTVHFSSPPQAPSYTPPPSKLFFSPPQLHAAVGRGPRRPSQLLICLCASRPRAGRGHVQAAGAPRASPARKPPPLGLAGQATTSLMRRRPGQRLLLRQHLQIKLNLPPCYDSVKLFEVLSMRRPIRLHTDRRQAVRGPLHTTMAGIAPTVTQQPSSSHGGGSLRPQSRQQRNYGRRPLGVRWNGREGNQL